MTADQITVLAILGSVVGLFLWGKWRHDLVAVLESPRVLIGTGTLDDAFFEVLEKADILRVSDGLGYDRC